MDTVDKSDISWRRTEVVKYIYIYKRSWSIIQIIGTIVKKFVRTEGSRSILSYSIPLVSTKILSSEISRNGLGKRISRDTRSIYLSRPRCNRVTTP